MALEPNVSLATSEDIKQLFRDVDDHVVAAILALRPTIAQLEEAAVRTSGAGDIFGGVRPQEGIVAQIIELAGMDADQLEEQPPESWM